MSHPLDGFDQVGREWPLIFRLSERIKVQSTESTRSDSRLRLLLLLLFTFAPAGISPYPGMSTVMYLSILGLFRSSFASAVYRDRISSENFQKERRRAWSTSSSTPFSGPWKKNRPEKDARLSMGSCFNPNTQTTRRQFHRYTQQTAGIKKSRLSQRQNLFLDRKEKPVAYQSEAGPMS